MSEVKKKRTKKHKKSRSSASSKTPDVVPPISSPPTIVETSPSTPKPATSPNSGFFNVKDADGVRLLLSNGSPVDIVDERGNTPLHIAALSSLPDVAKAILSAPNVNDSFVNRRTSSGDTALHISARSGNLQLCSLLISSRADPNIKNAEGQTALHLAAERSSVALVSLLCENEANVRACDDRDRTPLHLAASSKNDETDVLSYLLKHDAQINSIDKDGKQPLDYALKLGHESKCHILQASGADVGLRYRPREKNHSQTTATATAITTTNNSPAPSTTPTIASSSTGNNNNSTSNSNSAASSSNEVEENQNQMFDKWGFEDADSVAAENAIPHKVVVKLAKKERERAAKWAEMMKSQAAWDKIVKKEPSKLRRRCYKGIPESARGKAWMLLAKAEQRKSTFPPGYYSQLLIPKGTSGEQIDLDINRCFRNHLLFKERYGNGQISLWNVLKAYSNYDVEVSYCQGMSEIAAVLLMYLPEEDAFWTLVQLLNDPNYALRNMFLSGFPALHTAFSVHTQLVKKFLPKLHTHFEQQNISTIFYATKWFMTLLNDVLPWELCIRVWDAIFLDGVQFLHTISLRILEFRQKELISLPFEQLMFRLTSMKEFKCNPDEFIMFVTKNRLSESLLASFRLVHTKEVFKENAQHNPPPTPGVINSKGKSRQSDEDTLKVVDV